MNNKIQKATYTPLWFSAVTAKVDDLKQLVKFGLTFFVVISSLVGYLLASQGQIQFLQLLYLTLGGFLITGSANTLNQIIEKDYDALMIRTAKRPLPAGRMEVTEAIIWAGVMGIAGILFLALFNLITAVLGAASLILYAFIYTPLKRITPLSVAVGAIPGALPAVIGCFAVEGRISILALALFGIQFFWQFPHFWSIGWLGFDEYKKAGFNIMPLPSKERDHSIGMYSLIYALFLIPISLLFVFYPKVSSWAIGALCIAAIGYAFAAWGLFKYNDQYHARRLLFASLFYLPLIQIILLIDKWL